MPPPNYTPLYAQLANSPLAAWAETLPTAVSATLTNHGKMAEWQAALAQLPPLTPSHIDLHHSVTVGTAADASDSQRQQLETALRAFHPWRKGPFHLYGLHLDTEWRSDWKWERVLAAGVELNGRFILDVGSSNGYYGWRMVGAGAQLVLGLDPFPLYVMQYAALTQLIGPQPNYVLPLGIEALPNNSRAFDTVFSLGVLYHRRSPFDHLYTLRQALRPGGQLVLETLVIEGELGDVLVPEGRYAQMGNVWFIPSPPTLLSWLRKAGFVNPRLHDVAHTTPAEQRTTHWMTFQSLPDFLDPRDPSRTIEGHPAPKRALITAVSPA